MQHFQIMAEIVLDSRQMRQYFVKSVSIHFGAETDFKKSQFVPIYAKPDICYVYQHNYQ